MNNGNVQHNYKRKKTKIIQTKHIIFEKPKPTFFTNLIDQFYTLSNDIKKMKRDPSIV